MNHTLYISKLFYFKAPNIRPHSTGIHGTANTTETGQTIFENTLPAIPNLTIYEISKTGISRLVKLARKIWREIVFFQKYGVKLKKKNFYFFAGRNRR